MKIYITNTSICSCYAQAKEEKLIVHNMLSSYGLDCEPAMGIHRIFLKPDCFKSGILCFFSLCFRPLLHVTVELTMKKTSRTRNSPKYPFARSLKIPTESEYRLCAMTSERGGRHSVLEITIRKHTKWKEL